MKQKQIRFQKKKKSIGQKKYLVENFLKVMTDTKPQNQEAQKHYGE